MMTPRVSVAICTFNGAAFVGEQLKSVLAQDRLPDEIVIADDGSSDDTRDVAGQVLGLAPNSIEVRVLAPSTSPLGVTANFERALRATTGDLVVLADQDDLWAPERISATLPVFDDDSVLLHAHDAALVDTDGSAIGRTQLEAMNVSSSELATLNSPAAYKALVRRNVLPGMTFMMRRDLVVAALPLPPAWPHDYYLAFVAGSMGGLRVSSRADLISYRQHGANAVGSRGSGFVASLRRAHAASSDVGNRVKLFATLDERLGACPETADAVREVVHEKLAFEQRRLTLPTSWARRLNVTLREAAAGRYQELASAGTLGVIQDLFWPAQSPERGRESV